MNNICNYDKNIFNLDISYEPNGLEGGSCKTIYNFEIIKKCNSIKSIIEYIEDYSNYKYHIYYEYNSNQNNIIKIKEIKSISNFKSKSKYNNIEKTDINNKTNDNKNKGNCIIL